MLEAAYFDPPAWPPERAHLQSVIGLGRRAQMDTVSLWLSLRFHRAGSHASALLPIELILEGQAVYAWVEERAFVEWLEPVLSVPNVAALAPELRCAACAWILAPWLTWCAQHGLTTPSLKALGKAAARAADISEPVYAVLTLASNDAEMGAKRLDLVLTNFPCAWLNALAHRMDVHPEPRAQALSIDVMGSAGFARIPVEQLIALRVGDVVFATGQAPLAEGRVFCCVGALFFQACRLDQHRFEVERIMTAFDEDVEMVSDTAQSAPESAIGDLPMTLVFEIGRMPVPLTRLAGLQVGDVLETALGLAPEIGIRAQGKLIAAAKLVRVGERLGAQITRMMHSDLALQERADTDKPVDDPVAPPSDDITKSDEMDLLQ